jgi:hypothetical protein
MDVPTSKAKIGFELDARALANAKAVATKN